MTEVVPIRRRTPGEVLAYIEGYNAALKAIREAIERAQLSIDLAQPREPGQ